MKFLFYRWKVIYHPVNNHHWSVDVLDSAVYTFIDICRAIPATKLLSTSSYKLGFYRYGWGSSTFRNTAADSIYILIRGWLSMTQLLLEHSWRSHYNHNKLRCLSQGLHSKFVVVLSPCFSLWCHFWPVIKHCSSLSFQQLTVDTFLHSNWSSCSFLVSTEWLTITAGSYGERSINQSINQSINFIYSRIYSVALGCGIVIPSSNFEDSGETVLFLWVTFLSHQWLKEDEGS